MTKTVLNLVLWIYYLEFRIWDRMSRLMMFFVPRVKIMRL